MSTPEQIAQLDPSLDELVDRQALDEAARDRSEERGQGAAPLGPVDGAQETRADSGFRFLAIPVARPDAASGSEREDELLAARAETASGSVEAVENDLLDCAVDPAPRERGAAAAR